MAECRTLARPYAKAVFHLANQKGSLSEWTEVLNFLSLVVQEPRVQSFLKNQTISRTIKAEAIIAVGLERFDAQEKNFVKLLAEKDRWMLVPDIAGLYEELRDEAQKMMRFKLIVASELNQKQEDQLKSCLEKRFKKTVVFERKTDPTLLGGAIFRTDSEVFDGSLMGRLALLRESLMEAKQIANL